VSLSVPLGARIERWSTTAERAAFADDRRVQTVPDAFVGRDRTNGRPVVAERAPCPGE
jgi:hypothetical protein